ncbi:MAG: hypothetical protein D3904_03530 [Candidatus Electrothrix sp. EH2]|nr:hypothetical protein [Candidatus Electrothrix sp. EH2]
MAEELRLFYFPKLLEIPDTIDRARSGVPVEDNDTGLLHRYKEKWVCERIQCFRPFSSIQYVLHNSRIIVTH